MIRKIFFSPTLTTKKVVDKIAEGLSVASGMEMTEYDFTTPKMRESIPELGIGDIVVFGMPTYAGRLPNLMLPYLNTLEGNGAKVIPVVTFGNRNFDNSLFELISIMNARNFDVFAAAAFSCEHSFGHVLGEGRPDFDDLEEAYQFGKKMFEFRDRTDPFYVPGNLQDGYYKPQDRNGNFIDIRKVKPKTKDSCTGCGACIRNCPMGAINPEDPKDITGTCIKCNSCVKRCKMNAKYFDDSGYMYHHEELIAMYAGERKANSFFY